MASTAVSTSALPVRTMNSVSASASRAQRRISRPDASGSLTSTSATSNSWRPRRLMPSAPELASPIVNPPLVRTRPRSARTSGSSSTTATRIPFDISRHHSIKSHRGPNIGAPDARGFIIVPVPCPPQEGLPDAAPPGAQNRRSSPEQPQEHQPGDPARPPDRRHRCQRLREVVAGLRHDLRRGPVALHRIALDLRSDVPGPGGSPRRRPDRADSPGSGSGAEEPRAHGALDRRHCHRGLRLPPPPLRQDRPRALPVLRRGGGLSLARIHRRPAAGRARREPGHDRLPPAGTGRSRSRRAVGDALSARLRPRSDGRHRGRSRRASPPTLESAREVVVVLDRVALDPAHQGRLTDSVEMALREGSGRMEVEVVGHGRLDFAEALKCPRCGLVLVRPQPLLFSFNHPLGACPECKGFGNVLKYDESLVIPDPTRSLADGAVEPWTYPSGRWYQRQLLKAAKRHGLDTAKPYADLTEPERRFVYDGHKGFPGIQGFFEEVESYRYKLHVRVFLSRYRSQSRCPACGGARLKPEALAVRVAGLTVADFTALTIEQATRVVAELKLSAWETSVAREILKQLTAKLTFLLRVGLGYLTLARQARSLSGGEAQRINLANQLGSQLVGTLYVLDEPSIGLHARDTARLADLCRELAQAGNTVIVVEHDRTFMEAADHVVELG